MLSSVPLVDAESSNSASGGGQFSTQRGLTIVTLHHRHNVTKPYYNNE
jgi:hypothetical protein